MIGEDGSFAVGEARIGVFGAEDLVDFGAGDIISIAGLKRQIEKGLVFFGLEDFEFWGEEGEG